MGYFYSRGDWYPDNELLAKKFIARLKGDQPYQSHQRTRGFQSALGELPLAFFLARGK